MDSSISNSTSIQSLPSVCSSSAETTAALCTKQLLQHLRTFELVISEMLLDNRPTLILKEKLYDAEETVSMLVDDCISEKKVANQWRLKLASWWKAYAVAEDLETQRKLPPNLKDTSEASPKTLGKLNLFAPPLMWIDPVFDDALSREYLCSQIVSAFTELSDLHSDADFEGMRRLISTVVRSFDLVPPNAGDPKLQTSIFEAAFVKIPETMRQCFCTQYEPPYRLYSLFHYLRLEIADYCDNNKLLLMPQYTPRIQPWSPNPPRMAKRLRSWSTVHDNTSSGSNSDIKSDLDQVDLEQYEPSSEWSSSEEEPMTSCTFCNLTDGHGVEDCSETDKVLIFLIISIVSIDLTLLCRYFATNALIMVAINIVARSQLPLILCFKL